MTLGSWSDEGCLLALGSDGASSRCACDHATNFAVLFDTGGDLQDLSETSEAILNYLSFALCGISAMSCLLTYLALQTSK